jgi:hypothetical protein
MDYLNEPPRRYDPFFISIRNLFITLRPPPGAATEAEKTARDAEIIAGMGDCNPGPLVAQDKHNYYEYRSYGWKRIILVHHLCENKYAHNGIGQDEIDSVLLNALYSKSYRNIVRIHTLLHSYDMLFMNKFGTENFWLNYSFIYGSLNRIRANAAGLYDRNFIKCYEHLLTAHAGDFLRRNAAGIITTPYRIQTDDAAALQQKTRQYDYQPNYIEIKERYQRQIRPAVFGAAPVVQAGTTTLLPNVEPFANLEIQIAAKKLEKTIDAVLGIAPIVGINIISVGQAINLCINTSSETGLLEGPAVGIVNVDVFNALITPHITDEDRALAAADAAAINAIINPAAAAAVPAAAAAAVPAGGVAVPGHNPRRRKTRRSYNLRHTRRKARRF